MKEIRRDDGLERMLRAALGVKHEPRRIPTPSEMAKEATVKTPRVTKNGRMDE